MWKWFLKISFSGKSIRTILMSNLFKIVNKIQRKMMQFEKVDIEKVDIEKVDSKMSTVGKCRQWQCRQWQCRQWKSRHYQNVDNEKVDTLNRPQSKMSTLKMSKISIFPVHVKRRTGMLHKNCPLVHVERRTGRSRSRSVLLHNSGLLILIGDCLGNHLDCHWSGFCTHHTGASGSLSTFSNCLPSFVRR